MAHSLLFVQTPWTNIRPAGALATSAQPCRTASHVSRRPTVSMAAEDVPSTWEEYVKKREQGGLHGGTMKEAQTGMLSFIAGGGDMEFDGGDSGGGVVGDGNCDLEDQHNSTEFLREGFLSSDGKPVQDKSEHTGKIQSATSSRLASAGKNYFGRSTGYADEKIKQITEEDRKKHRLDEVRAQQLENWHNQRAIHEHRKAGQETQYYGAKSYAPINYKDSLSKADTGPAQRRDGKEWGEVKSTGSEEVEATYEVTTKLSQTHVTEIQVKNLYFRFMPFRVGFTSDSHPFFSVEPTSGTMERSSGNPTDLIVRFSPKSLEGDCRATLIFETEEFKFVYKFIGHT
eukprot:Plantae.Rhodophyta-Purpureofilum_apyrenoidigerum.ctg10856.p1 GENE.Plantae.Rhodophyta-Purpureofilum_apyrenoidigerum.ctg10856~~Plantae.Rhodophyta-Purpureofilum_apyrenoidigerum.ctg10856.p1  ORF type:complete len:343 (-),score=53.23 Plantae.Rhodophyta-Purpureofilum_apyrenoidigerum.ctg10856:139-1167(-)